jgi:hypothetical protein
MPAIWFRRLLSLAIVPILGGCFFVPKTTFNEIQSENRVLTEQNRAQLTEIGNLREHAKTLEDRLARTEEEMALSQEQNDRNGHRMAQSDNERPALRRE